MNATGPAPCDTNIAASAKARSGKGQGYTLFASILASSLSFIDGSVVNVALPTIGGELGGGGAGLQWIINAYMLPLSVLLLLGGAAGDRFGRRRLFVGGIALFAVASVVCMAAPSLELLLAGRALQGIASAMLMPNSLALLGAAFDGEARGRAIGTWAAAGAVAGAVGPMLGGWLVEVAGWRTIFLVNLPLCAGAILLGLTRVEESRDDSDRPLDRVGVAVATLALGAITYGLTILSGADRHPVLGWGAAAGGIAAMLLFVWIEQRRGDRAIMPLAMFATSSFAGLTVLTFFLYAALGALMVALPYVLITLNGFTPVQAGAGLLPVAAVIALASRAMGGVAGRIGSRLPLTIGPLVVAVGFALLSRIAADASYWTTTLPALLVVAFGMAGAVAPLTTGVMASVDQAHVGTANGFNSAVARTGGLIATALLGGVLATQGAALAASFRLACWVMAGAAVVSGLSALLLLKGREMQPKAGDQAGR